MSKSKWVSKAIRRIMTQPRRIKDGIPCQVCEKNKHITEAHHAISVEELTDIVNNYNLPLSKIKTPLYWLCPNCHTYLHKLPNINFEDRDKRVLVVSMMFESGYTREQVEKMYHLKQEALEAKEDLICDALETEIDANLNEKEDD